MQKRSIQAWLLLFLHSHLAYGVMGRSLSPILPQDQNAARRYHINLPVSWQIIRSEFKANSVHATSESYVENWLLSVDPQGHYYLRSQRIEVPVVSTSRSDDLSVVSLPREIIVEEGHFADLIGVDMISLRDSETQRLVALNLGRNTPAHPADIILKITEDAHLEVHFEIKSTDASK